LPPSPQEGTSELDILLWTTTFRAAEAEVELAAKGIPGDGPIHIGSRQLLEQRPLALKSWGPRKLLPANNTGGLKPPRQLQLIVSPQWVRAEDSTVTLAFALPRQAISLIQLSLGEDWERRRNTIL
jgi:hypothetical protein